MLRVLAILLVFCGTALSEESSPGESKTEAPAAQTNSQHTEKTQQPAAPTGLSAPPIINIYTAKHAGEEGQCAQPKEWKEWASFTWCRSLEWIDAERVIAVWTVVLGIATWRLWSSTDRLVKGADLNAERQLRAYISFTPQSLANAYPNCLPKASFTITNTGQTPAYNIRYTAILEVLPHPLVKHQGDLVAVHSDPPTAGRPIHSKDQIFGDATSLNKMTFEEYQKMIGPNHRLYLAGIIWYEDIFKGETRKTKFCVCVGGEDYGVFATQAFTSRKPIIVPMADWAFSHVHNDAT
jgi:hypothetical protein